MAMQFQRASKRQARLRMALAGPAGSGKTFTALTVAKHLAGDGTVAVIDTERGSASKYADLAEFDVLELDSFHPNTYIDAIHAAEQAGYAVLVIDSLSHAWNGKDGALELVDRAAKRDPRGNSYAAWRDVTPLQTALIDAMLGARLHLIVTLRTKQDYVQEVNERGRTVIRKVGLAPIQRDGLEYEFDVFGELTIENTLLISKTRCSALTGAAINHPGAEIATTLRDWLSEGAPAAADPPIDEQLAAAGEKNISRFRAPEPTPEEQARANAMAQPEAERIAALRLEAIARYRQLSAVATERKHKHAKYINEQAPEDMDNQTLRDRVVKLEEMFPDVPEQSATVSA